MMFRERKFRKEMIKAAVEEDINTIFTMVYAKGPDDKYVENIRNLVESKRGRVCFVRLHCNKVELLYWTPLYLYHLIVESCLYTVQQVRNQITHQEDQSGRHISVQRSDT